MSASTARGGSSDATCLVAGSGRANNIPGAAEGITEPRVTIAAVA
ncbi:MAG TPA: hypothetical protein VGK32_15050 [Vicinamibacterales bacterium]|jgi:hypothetical protein